MADIEDRIVNTIATDTQDPSLATAYESDEGAVYKVLGDTRRPVSKHAGPLWKSRRDAANRKLEQSGKKDNWDECIRYYKNDQRIGKTGKAHKTRAERLGDRGSSLESENIVFANTSALVPAIYAKNPSVEVTPNVRDDQQEGGVDDRLRNIVRVSERLANALANKKSSPGINLKPKARKAVVMATLTNIAYLEVGYTLRAEASEQALADLDRIATQLEQAKDEKDIRCYEGELEALESKINFLRPSGPWVKFRHPKHVLRDPDSTEADMSDARWIMIMDLVSTDFINAVYRVKRGDDKHASIYKPTHIVNAGSTGGIEEDVNNFTLLKGNTDYKSYGYSDDATFNAACRTKVWYVWDKITRRVYMFNDEDWTWPIWVWDDPYNLDTFFPVVPLEFYTDPEDDIANSEVVYYLDQQDAINESNAERAKIRKRITGTIWFNKNLIKDTKAIDAFMSGTDTRAAIPVDAPPDADLNKIFSPMVPPSASFLPLLDTRPYVEAASRVSSVQPVMQGQQFKTNTTNEAIETYNSNQQTRIDEKIDAVEDTIGLVMWLVLQMCMQFMTREEVATVIGDHDAAAWEQLTADEIKKSISLQVVGGSSQKPTSRTKKQEAVQMGQVLGQFANAGNGAAIMLILKVFERAFDELVITTEDWQFLQQSIVQQIGNSNPQGTGQPQPGSPAEGQQPDAMAALTELINTLPPELKQALGKAMAQGVPIEEALPRILEAAQAGGVPQ